MLVPLLLAATVAGSPAPARSAPTPAGITADLERVRAYLESAMPARIVDGRTGRALPAEGTPVRGAVADRGPEDAFNPLAYEVGVVHTGMLAAAEATGDRRFDAFTSRQLTFIADALPYFRAQAERWGAASNSFRPILAPAALDDCGAMEAALVQARLEGVGPDLSPVIQRWAAYLGREQFRLPGGAFARHRPQPVTVWADDMYMALPAMAELGRMTHDPAWLNGAVRGANQFCALLFRPAAGLFAHGWRADNPSAPDIFWGRANGWAMLALEDVLDAAPPDKPGRGTLVDILRAQIRGVAERQSASGLWHQLLDRDDSFEETSCSAMFVYGIAHAIDQGWINPAAYGAVAIYGWDGVARQINAQGQVENTCVGTTLAGSPVYYYHRPVSVYAVHGYGPVLLAGAEMIRFVSNPKVAIVPANETFHSLRK